MEDQFYSVINDLIDAKSGGTSILAVSGGVDSVVMAQLFYDHKLPFILAHCNFQLRGEDSEKDEQFVKELASKMSVEVMVKRFETASYANDNGISIQMAARDLRYNWFKQLAEELNTKVAIAHNANDVVETVLFNLSKGTGIAGLHGIAKVEKHFIRPLLWAKREGILSYAENKNLDWREDISNQSEKYMRNLVRKSVIPQFERINPSFLDSILKTTSRLKEVEEFFQNTIDNLSLVYEKEGHIFISKEKLLKLPGLGAVLYYLLSPYGYNFDQTDSIIKALDSQGAMFYSGDWMLNIDREELILSKNAGDFSDIIIAKEDSSIQLDNGYLEIDIIDRGDFRMNTSASVANLDLDKLVFPLLVRSWREGDRFQPLGMKGKKMVSDFLIDEKVPLNFKKNQLVLVSDNNIPWVIGQRIDDRYKTTPDTNKIYRLQFLRK
ncbi:MAG: tRNA lysidine(34) synthetase TilS [Bacteroidota bacterium]